jgi:hypothetical protein
MAKLVYSAITSLDGYIADKDGKVDWAVPDEEVLAFINDLERSRPRRPRLQGRFGRRVPVGSSHPSWWEEANKLSPMMSV